MSTIKGKWVFNDLVSTELSKTSVTFTSNGTTYTAMELHFEMGEVPVLCYYYTANGYDEAYSWGSWNMDGELRNIDFGTTEQTVSDAFYNWLTDNATPETLQATIKAGTYRFNDVLVPINEEAFTQDIAFTVKCNMNIPAMPEYGFEGYTGQHIFAGSKMLKEPVTSNGNGSLAYNFISVEPALPDSVMTVFGISFPDSMYVYHAGEEPNGWEGYESVFNSVQTIIIETDQEVTEEFYNWFSKNTIEVKPTIKAGKYRFNDTLNAIPYDVLKFAFNATDRDKFFDANNIVIEPLSVYYPPYDQDITITNFSPINEFGDIYVDGEPTTFFQFIVILFNHSAGQSIIHVDKSSVEALKLQFTVPNDQEVSAEFADWFSENTTEIVEKSIIKAGTYHFNDVPARHPHNTKVDLKFTTTVSTADFPYGIIAHLSKFDVSGYNAPDYGKLVIYWTVESTTPNIGLSGRKFWSYDDADVSSDGWRDDFGYDILTITIPYDQEVPTVFYDWFMSSVEEQKHEATIKAGTYRFNADLTPPLFSEYVNLPFTIPDVTFYLYEEAVSEVNQIAAVDSSLGTVEVGTYTWSFTFTGFQVYHNSDNSYSILESLGMNSTCTNTSPLLKYLGDAGWIVYNNEIYHSLNGNDIDKEYQTITVLEDTMVSNDFASWFSENTKFIEKTIIKAGTYRWDDVLPTAAFIENDTSTFFPMKFKVNPLPFIITDEQAVYLNQLIEQEYPGSPSVTAGTFDITLTFNNIELCRYGEDYQFIVEYNFPSNVTVNPYSEAIYSTASCFSYKELYNKVLGGAHWVYDFSHIGIDWWTIDFQTITLETDQEVDKDFAAWFIANTKDVSATIKAGTYRFNDVLTFPTEGSVIGEIIFSQTFTYDGVSYTTASNIISASHWLSLVINVTDVTPAFAFVSVGTVYLYNIGGVSEVDGWQYAPYGVDLQTITIETNQDVSTEFALWFILNTTPLISIDYNGTVITIESGSGDTAVLHTKDKKLLSDIKISCTPVVQYEEWDGSFTVEDSITLISFTINGNLYESEEGMTWADWCDSEYNTGGWYISNGKVAHGSTIPVYISRVTYSDVIISDDVYETGAHSGGSGN